MTHQEKSKMLRRYIKLATGWKSDFIVSQFKQTWDIQKMLIDDLKEAGYTLLQITIAIQPLQVQRKAYAEVLKRRGDI